MATAVSLVPMTEAEFPVFLDTAIPGYAAANVGAGYWLEEEALEKSRQAYQDLLPEGVATPDQYLFTARDGENGELVGYLWFALRPQPGGRRAFVYNVEVVEGLRGRGYGRGVMEACSVEARKLGAIAVGLHVFADNEPAYRLYQSMGYQTSSLNMVLPL